MQTTSTLRIIALVLLIIVAIGVSLFLLPAQQYLTENKGGKNHTVGCLLVPLSGCADSKCEILTKLTISLFSQSPAMGGVCKVVF